MKTHIKFIGHTFAGVIVVAVLYGKCLAADPTERMGVELASALNISTNNQRHTTNALVFSGKQNVMAGELQLKQKRIIKSSQPGLHRDVDILNTNDQVIATGRVIECASSDMARKFLLEQLAMSSMTIETLAVKYKVIPNDVGELCIGEMVYDEASKALILDPSVIHFVRGGAAITIRTKDKSKPALEIARIIDQELAGAK